MTKKQKNRPTLQYLWKVTGKQKWSILFLTLIQIALALFATVQAAGLPCPQALTFATYAAAITISRMGAMPALPTLEEVNTLLLRQGHSEIDVQLLRNVLG